MQDASIFEVGQLYDSVHPASDVEFLAAVGGNLDGHVGCISHPSHVVDGEAFLASET